MFIYKWMVSWRSLQKGMTLGFIGFRGRLSVNEVQHIHSDHSQVGPDYWAWLFFHSTLARYSPAL